MRFQPSAHFALDRSDQLQVLIPRRREFLTFITWPFFLSEAFKSMQAFGGLAGANDGDGPARGTPPEQAAAIPQLVEDAPISRPSLEPSLVQNANLAPADPPCSFRMRRARLLLAAWPSQDRLVAHRRAGAPPRRAAVATWRLMT
jgi:hypothetical protein